MRSREEVLKEIIQNGKKDPKGWKGTYRYDASVNAMEYIILHPKFGVYEIKEWQKNPYEVIGVGDKIARKVDEGLLNEHIGNFGIVRYNYKKLSRVVEEGIPLESLIEEMETGKNDWLKLELKGEMHSMPRSIDSKLKNRKKIDEKFLKILNAERAFDGYV
ncbi:MAG: hypothetical protein U9O96_06205 [Candidatus Thermoplasmatota archaeon]|nr:hypothetical protein [Candidatus Thermoplasmatota archaeon]